MSLELTKVTSEATVTVRVRFSGGQPLKHEYSRWTIVPEYLNAVFVLTTGMDENGHPVDKWLCSNLELSGPRVLTPGPDGEQRLGKQWGDVRYVAWTASGEDALDEAPDEIRDLVGKLRPTGAPELPASL